MLETGGEKKIPYTPPAEKRYQISRDPITQERIRFMRQLQKELSEITGMEIGMTLFGSITKGKPLLNGETARATDIDCTIFFDVDLLKDRFDGLYIKIPAIREAFDKSARDADSQYWIFWEFLRDKVERSVSVNGHIVHGTIQPEITGWSRTLNENIEIQLEELTGNGLFGHGGMPTIARAFQLEVGQSMDKYRARFLRALAKKDEQTREKVWTLIKRSIQHNERYENGESPIKYLPKTFDDAFRKYIGGRHP